MTKTLTKQWKDGELPVGSYYIYLVGNVERVDFFGGLGWERTKDFGIEEVLAPVPSYQTWKEFQQHFVDSLELEVKLKKAYEELEKQSIEIVVLKAEKEQLVSKTNKLEKRLEIATKALEKFKEKERDYLDYGIDNDGNKIYLYPNRVATKALKEMEGVK